MPDERFHEPSFSCTYPAEVDPICVGGLYGPNWAGEYLKMVSTESLPDGRCRAYFEVAPHV